MNNRKARRKFLSTLGGAFTAAVASLTFPIARGVAAEPLSYAKLTDTWLVIENLAAGADAGAAIQAAVTSLPSTGGVIDCTKITNNVVIATPPFEIPEQPGIVTTKPIMWIIGGNEYFMKVKVLLPSHFRLDARGTLFKRAPEFLPPKIELDDDPGIFQTVARKTTGTINAGSKRITLGDMTGVEPGCVIAVKGADGRRSAGPQHWLVTVIDAIVSRESKQVDIRHEASVSVSRTNIYVGAKSVVFGGSFTIDGQKGLGIDTPTIVDGKEYWPVWYAIVGDFAAGLIVSENARIEKCANGVDLAATHACIIDGSFYDNGRLLPDNKAFGAHVWVFGQCRGNIVKGWYRGGTHAIIVDELSKTATRWDGQGQDSMICPYMIDSMRLGIHLEGNQYNCHVDAATIKNISGIGIRLSNPNTQPHSAPPTNCTIRTGTIHIHGGTHKVFFESMGGNNVLYTREPATQKNDADMLVISTGNYGYSGDNRYNNGSGWVPA